MGTGSVYAAEITDTSATQVELVNDDSYLTDEAKGNEGVSSDKNIKIQEESINLMYDDRYSIDTDLNHEEYQSYKIDQVKSLNRKSYSVRNGQVQSDLDEVLTKVSDEEVLASGVGTAELVLVPKDEENGDAVYDAIYVSVNVEPAPLTIMYLMGQVMFHIGKTIKPIPFLNMGKQNWREKRRLWSRLKPPLLSERHGFIPLMETILSKPC